MAVVTDQDVPPSLLKKFDATLTTAVRWIEKVTTQRRYPWRLKHMQGNGRIVRDTHKGKDFTDAQFEQRKIFRLSCDCFNIQDPSHDIIDPPSGPKSRGYWHNQAEGSGLWYYDYFMQQTINEYKNVGTPTWCKLTAFDTVYVRSFYPNTNYYLTGSIPVKTESNTGEYWALVTKIHPQTTLMHFKITAISAINGSIKNVKIDLFEIPTYFDKTTVTWNTKPAKGAFLGTLTVPITSPPAVGWYAVQVPNIWAFYMIAQTRSPLPFAYSITFLGTAWSVVANRPFYT